MSKFKHLFLAFTTIIIVFAACQEKEHNSTEDIAFLRSNFESPPAEYGVNCWWWWLNGNVTKEAITKDLEAMKSRNFHGAMIFDAGGHNHRGHTEITAGPLYGSDEWNELFVFALDEAKRLGLEIGFNIQSGWNLGGPRVTPQYAAKQITVSRTVVEGGSIINITLEQPPTRFDYYRDISVFAVKKVEDSELKEGISDLSLKLGFRELGGSAPDCRFLLTNEPRNPNNPDIHPAPWVDRNDVIDLRSNMDQDGTLEWDAPAGEWSLIRLGYTCTNAHVSTSSNQWQGLVLDYMSKEAFDFYWADVVDPIFNAASDHIGTTLKHMETDSWECGGMNWTENLIGEFKHYRGYDLNPYLPILAGFVIDNLETTNAFLADFRKTLGDLVAYNHYAVFADYAKKYNMGIQPESAGPHAGPMDGIKNYGFSDIVMSEFWSPSPHRPRPENRYFLKQASSAAHIYGKKIIGAESFTTIGPQWNDELWHDQKSAFDHEICAGLNRLYFHTFTASPKEMGLPGQEYFAGTHVNPQVTWWHRSGPFIDYMHRTQLMVQNGQFVADVLYYYGDHVPNVFSIKATDPAGAIPGYDYDVTDENILLQLTYREDRICTPSGMQYRVLVLPDHRVLSMNALQKVETLLKSGAHIIGYKPEAMTSLTGGAEAQEAFKKLSDKIWGDNPSGTGQHKYRKGIIAWGISAREYLKSLDLSVDFEVVEEHKPGTFDYIHYTLGNQQLYFVTNQSTQRQSVSCRFRISGQQPELWDALTGDIRQVKAFSQKNGLTTVPLTFEPYGAIMLVFTELIEQDLQGNGVRNYVDYEPIHDITGPWTVAFDPNWGGPESITFPELSDWTLHLQPGIKYYSGTATYTKTQHLDILPDGELFLQLGSVKDVGIATIKLNGKDLGTLWTAPFRVKISGVLTKGENKLEIEVINSWYNRVAGDQILKPKKPYTSTNIVLGNDFRGRKLEDGIPLESSGLLGPVQIVKEIKH